MELCIGWLFPDLMSTYGDRGNVFCLKKRSEWRGISVKVVPITGDTQSTLFSEMDLIIGGGSQNKEQEIAFGFLEGRIGECLIHKIEKGTPALFICGAMQMLGKSFQTSSRQIKNGLGFFDCSTLFQENAPRLTGDLIFKITAKRLLQGLNHESVALPLVLGFENHSGCTFIGNGEVLGEVIQGYGNNGKDGFEGIFHKNAIGSYAHGPLLPKNPFLADWLIHAAITLKYQKNICLSPIEDGYSSYARADLLKRYGLR